MIDIDFQVGDKIVDSDGIYEVFKAENGCLFYRVSSDGGRHDSVTCSIPIKNVLKAGLRKPISKEEANELKSKLAKAMEHPTFFDLKMSESMVFDNDWGRNIELLASIWMVRQSEGGELSRANERMAESLIGQMTREISLVTGKTNQEIRKEITKTLGNEN